MVTINGGDRIVEFGDSITASYLWPAVTGGLIDQINAQFAPQPASASIGTATGNRAVVTGARSAAAVVAAVPKAVGPVRDGLTSQSGWTTFDILNNLTAALAEYFPAQVALIHIGINDVDFGEALSAYYSNMNSIWDQIHAADPNTQILQVGLMCQNELWDSVTGWDPGPNAHDSLINQANAFLAAAPATRPYITYVDIRTPLLALERINNTTPVNGTVVGVTEGIYTVVDGQGVHPLTDLKLLMAQECMGAIQVIP